MAKTKKRTTKSSKTKKITKPVAKSAPKRRAVAAPALSDSAVLGLVKPPSDYGDTIHELARAWRVHKKYVRSGDMTPNRLESLLKKSLRDFDKESDLEAKQAEKLRPLRDARLRSEAATWSAALNVWDIVKAVSDDHPEVASAFANVRAALTNASKKKPTPPAAG